MAIVSWVIAICIIILIFAIGTGIGLGVRNAPKKAADQISFSIPSVWGSPMKGPNKDKNICQLYQFESDIVDIGGIPTVIQGTPTFDSQILDNLQGQNILTTCLDPDQIIARQLEHNCIAPTGASDPQTTNCNL